MLHFLLPFHSKDLTRAILHEYTCSIWSYKKRSLNQFLGAETTEANKSLKTDAKIVLCRTILVCKCDIMLVISLIVQNTFFVLENVSTFK